jgi:predicted dienelactone hydrolase
MSTLLALLVSSVLAADIYSTPGPYAWGERTVNVPTPGTPFGVNAKVYYPAVSQGSNTNVSNAGPFPVIAFGHGFFIGASSYDSTLRHLASRGYIVVATSSQEFTFNPNREQYIADMSRSVDYMIAQNSTAGSPFEGRVNSSQLGISGHSLGGGIALVAASRDSRFKATATLAAASLRDAGPLGAAPPPYADVEVANLNIPVSLINGSADGVIPVATNGQVIYDAASGPRMLPSQTGGFHQGFTDFPFAIGETPGVTGAEQLEYTRAELTSFFDLYLKGDQSAWRRQWGPERLALASDNPSILTQLDPGFSIAAVDPTLFGNPGDTENYELVITNTSDRADRYDLFSEDNEWGVSFSSLTTPLLAPGESFSLRAYVAIPIDAQLDAFDTALISGRSVLDGGTRAFTYITTAVPEVGSLLYSGAALLLVVAVRIRGLFGCSQAVQR